MLGKAITIAADLFQNKKDKGGFPYILHCIRVMETMPKDDLELKQIAILHDVIEDTDYTISRLRFLGFSERVVQAVSVLTHDPKDSYEFYIKKIALNLDAVKVKKADLIDNSDITRLKDLTKKDFDRMERYHRAYTYLKNI